MALCTSCSAPLPANTAFCSYCGTRNDLDVQAVQRFTGTPDASLRHCPDCGLPMETIRLGEDGSFAVERCPDCFGMFFDPGEVQAFLDASVTPAFEVNRQEIASINRERGSTDRPIRYVKCPDCGKLMNRVNFGPTSGVIMDQCKAHGVWLGNGELIHLMEWKRAGGQILAEERLKVRREERVAVDRARPSFPVGSVETPDATSLDDLLSSAVHLVSRLFR